MNILYLVIHIAMLKDFAYLEITKLFVNVLIHMLEKDVNLIIINFPYLILLKIQYYLILR